MSTFDIKEYIKAVEASQSCDACSRLPALRLGEDTRFIFVSYAHEDYKKVYADLAELYARGIPFWYDKYLEAGQNWDDEVRKITEDPRCAGAIFFLSENLFLSQSIQTEIRITRGEDKCLPGSGRKLNYFSVNLTKLLPSQIQINVIPRKRFPNADDEGWARLSWLSTLTNAFPDKATFLPYDNPQHISNLVEQISGVFGIVPKSGQGDLEQARSRSVGGMNEADNADDSADVLFSGKGELTYSDGSSYDGGWRNGKRHGYGRLKDADGTIYEGYWKDGKQSGEGKATYANGSEYTGNWENGEQNGHGKATYPGGMEYIGQWKNGGFSGLGALKFPDGIVFECEWKDGKQSDYGKAIYPDGKVYIGYWKDGYFSGKGTLQCPDGMIYECQWEQGKQNGEGKAIYPDGSVYIGEWVNGEQCGKCSFLRGSDGHRYIGEWKGNGAFGAGVHIYPDGASCEGIWAGGMLVRGRGVLRYADGSVYDGEIENNMRHGLGTYTLANGKVKTGRFKKDVYKGKA